MLIFTSETSRNLTRETREVCEIHMKFSHVKSISHYECY